MLKIRLMRIGAKKKPFYRVVVLDERAKRTGAYIELLGTYNPLTEPKDIKLKKDRIDHWIKQGAQPSTGYLRIIGKAPQKPPRKPKKERKQATVDSGQVKQEESESQKTEEPKAETTQSASEEAQPEETASEETAKSTESEKPEEARGDGEEGIPTSSHSDPAKPESEDAPEETEPAGPRAEEKNEGSA